MDPTDDMMRQALAAQIPNLKTQAQLNLFLTLFDALRSTVNSYYGGDVAAAELARDALVKGLDMAKQMQEIAEKLNEVPEGERSDAAREFTEPAKELHEYDLHKRLNGELAAIKSLEALQRWYTDKRGEIDRIVSPNLRNSFFDSIRIKRKALEQN